MVTAKSTHNGEHPPVLNVTEARQGFRGLHVLWILIISTALAAAVLLFMLVIWTPRLSGPGGQVTTGQPAARASQPPPRSTP
jgi:hypothetical protein